MNNFFLAVLLALIATCATAKEKPEIVYVGSGRWACSGNSAACAQIDQNNRMIEEQRRARDDRRERERNSSR